MNLSEHFTLEEFTYSDTAKKFGLSNNPNETDLKCLKYTCENLLEPIRKLLNEKYGNASIRITSGYRNEQVNKKVGGVSTSQHRKGQAADIEVRVNGKVLPYTETYQNIKTWVEEGKLTVDQCLQEKSGSALWVHVSLKPSGNRNDFKKTVDGGKTFTTDKLVYKFDKLPYKVKTKQDLNIRSGAGMNFSKIRVAKKGEILTVWAIENNAETKWGKNGKEYFSLSYCERI